MAVGLPCETPQIPARLTPDEVELGTGVEEMLVPLSNYGRQHRVVVVLG